MESDQIYALTSRLTAAVAAVRDPYLLHAVHVLQVDVPPRLCLQQRVRAAALTVGVRCVAVDGAGGQLSTIQGRLEGRLVEGDVRHDCNVHHMGPKGGGAVNACASITGHRWSPTRIFDKDSRP